MHGAGRSSSTPSSCTGREESNCGAGSDIQIYEGGAGINCPVLSSPRDRDEIGGTSRQTELVVLSTLSLDEGRSLAEEQNRLTLTQLSLSFNCHLKEKPASEETTLESLRDHEDTVRYFTGLTDFVTLAAIFNVVSTHLPVEKDRVLSTWQVLMLAVIGIRVNNPSPKSCMYVSRSTASQAGF